MIHVGCIEQEETSYSDGLLPRVRYNYYIWLKSVWKSASNDPMHSSKATFVAIYNGQLKNFSKSYHHDTDWPFVTVTQV